MIKDYYLAQGDIHAKIDNFDLIQTFECGQCFRWNKIREGTYLGISKGNVLEIEQIKDRFVFRGTDMKTFENYWMDYLDLKRDYAQIIEKISVEPNMTKATEYGSGIRILLQEEWETLISFIISANNNIKRIKKIVESFSNLFGREIDYKGIKLHAFPKPDEISEITCGDLGEIRCGYRADYILDAVKKVNDGVVNISKIREMSYEEGVKELLKIKGVGPKVADCVLLYSGGKHESYPVDVWVKRVTEALYIKKETKPADIKKFADEMWGGDAGFAQQYLFYYARENQLEAGEV
ncbi:DNA-3-methyladenine glycosylase family protein [Alkalibacter mobilis]|uniref:DNA-3-methyladenine glycosylase family protein n=1 Tax=Alkalibacter mobilis TaxID=2787712 RepID=UPI00189F075A|nr:DNA glycosylase [Alkalibacter mobilis]MBF7096617.1 8-oxoguanine DNA glycosylase [Alkalibacter mobilis]